MAKVLDSNKGRGCGKEKARLDEIRRMKDMARMSLIRKYENGYEAHWIDKHPHGAFYRDVNDPSCLTAFPKESVMLLTENWTVVMFLKGLSDLERIENEMKLKRIYYANYGRGKDS